MHILYVPNQTYRVITDFFAVLLPAPGTSRPLTTPDPMPQNRPNPSLTVLASACLVLLSACATAPEAGQPPGTLTEVAATEPAAAASAATPASGASAAAAKPGVPAR